MDAVVSTTWRRAIIFDANLASKVEAIFVEFQNTIITEARSKLRIPSSVDFSRHALNDYFKTRENSDSDYYEIMAKADLIGEIRWSARLKNDVYFPSISKSDLLALPNVGAASVRKIALTFPKLGAPINIEFNSRLDWEPVTLEIRAEYSLLSHLREKFTVVLQEHTQHWWILRNSKFGGFLLGGILVAFIGLVAYAYMIDPSPPSSSSISIANFIWGMLLIGFFIVSYFWKWLFPMIEFQFGAGKRTAELKSKIRFALLTFLVLSVVGQQLMRHFI